MTSQDMRPTGRSINREAVLASVSDLFRRHTERGDILNSTNCSDPNWRALLAEFSGLDEAIVAAPAQSLADLAWKLEQVVRIVEDADGIGEWLLGLCQSCLDDALRFAALDRRTAS